VVLTGCAYWEHNFIISSIKVTGTEFKTEHFTSVTFVPNDLDVSDRLYICSYPQYLEAISSSSETVVLALFKNAKIIHFASSFVCNRKESGLYGVYGIHGRASGSLDEYYQLNYNDYGR
jgi:hypothetical protein